MRDVWKKFLRFMVCTVLWTVLLTVFSVKAR